MITTADFVAAADKAELAATVVPTGEYGDGVNIWLEGHRVPTTTVWWPTEGFDTFTWGHRFEYAAPHEVDAATLVQMVLDSKIDPRLEMGVCDE